MYHAVDEHGSPSNTVTVTLNVNPVANIALAVQEPGGGPVSDYRWLVQEDATFHVNPAAPGDPKDMLSTNFHKSYMPVVAQGCVGAGCNPDNADVPVAAFNQAALDPAKYYYVSVLPNDAGSGVGHTLGGVPIPPGTSNESVTVIVNNQPIPTAQLSVIVFEDNAPTNGVPDSTEPGLGGFQITLEDAGGRYGISGGTMGQDAYGNPLKNSLACAPASTAGVILTCPDGTALIKDLAPGKYGVVAVAPGGPDHWTQTSTIEGTKLQDNWVKAGEPPFLVEFGAPGFHAFIGFVNPEHTTVPPGPPGQQNNTITGSVTMVHTARPPSQDSFDSGSYTALSHTRAWVGLNSAGGTGTNIATVQADPEGHFQINGIPDGTYQLVIWDEYLDQIISYQTVTLPGGGDVGNIPVNTWFGRHEHNVFLDSNENGVRDPGEPGLPDQNVNLRFRDGTVEQSLATDTEGFLPFDQVFPYGAWQVAEIDYTRFKPTGVTVTVDGGGDVSGGPYPGLLNPQAGSPRTDTENPPVLLEGFQSMPGMTSIFEWGKAPYQPGENGGIAGIVFYASTRAENDPRLTIGEPWEPGIAGVKVRLYREVPTSGGGTALALVKEVQTDSWDASTPTGCEGEAADDPFVTQTLGGGESARTRCFDGIRNFEQVRPGAVFDGGYAFTGIPPGKYVVEVVPPPGYELVKEEDKNVDFGDSFATAPVAMMLPGGALVMALPDQAMVLAALAPEPGLAQPPCVGPDHLVPTELSLFPGVETYAPFANSMRPLCNRKEVILSDQSQAAADFHLFTSTPVVGQFQGLSTDDIATETNPLAPSFGDKWGPAFLPVSMRDFNGQEIYRGYTDAFGLYNGVLPSTYNANIPIPSGYSPAMHFVCLNDPGPLPGGGLDPLRNPNYGIFCYTAQFMPGTTTYLDTPLLPLSAFAAGFNPVECALPGGTPVIAWVDGAGSGPLVAPGGTLTIHSQGMTAVPNPAYEGPLTTAGSPYNEPTVMRDYGFGGAGAVTLNGIALTGVSWGNDQITWPVPAGFTPGAYQLVVTSGNGKSSINAVTVTVGTEIPVRVAAGGSIQNAIDNAAAGALILVEPGDYEELVVMWKPVRLQGAGAATRINAVKRPTEKLEAWRQKVQGLLDNGDVDLLPGQPAAFDLIGGGLFGTELGAGITVLARNDTSFLSNPSRIDGFTISGADGGGGIFVNGYAHNLQIANNAVTGNSGVIHGGIRVGHPSLPQTGDGPFGYNRNLNIHHNAITQNGGQSDTGVGGGLALCTGTDNYRVSRNYICGNFTLGSGAGIGHLGLSTPGLIEFNRILFNQSFNQGLNQSGGGILIAGEPSAAGGLTLGAGSVIVDANLIQGNQAGTGHGGGIRTQSVNGRDVELNPIPFGNWYQVRMTNNMIVNNVAGWSGGGISLQDTVNAAIILNTIANNDSTATVGAVIDAGNTSTRQPAGISSERNSLALDAVIPGAQSALTNFSNPTLTHNILWHNRAFTYDGTTATPRLLPVLNQAAVGGCPTGADYFDLGVLDPGFTLNPLFSILTSTTGYSNSNSSVNPLFLSAYCNGARSLRVPDGGTTMAVAPEAAEGGNFIDVRFGPLTQSGNYHIASNSPAIDRPGTQPSGANVNHDFDNQGRPSGQPPRVDWGADEVGSGSPPPPPAQGTVTLSATFTSPAGASLTATNLNFGNKNGLVSSTVTFTIGGTASVAFGAASVTNGTPAAFSKGADTCSGTTRSVGSSCTIVVNFNAPGPGSNSRTGTLTVPHNGAGNPTTRNLAGS
jgi:large repetitive protein